MIDRKNLTVVQPDNDDDVGDDVERALLRACQAAYDTGFAAALKVSAALVKGTNSEVTLRTIGEMLAVFDPPPKREVLFEEPEEGTP